MRIVVFILFLCLQIYAEVMPYNIKPAGFYSKKIDILDSKEFVSKGVSEISDLAFCHGVLYGVGDGGYLYKFDLKIKNNKIEDIKHLQTFSLDDRDAEGLKCVDNRLLISFEQDGEVAYFDFEAHKIKDAKIDKILLDEKRYKSANKSLESVTYNTKYGVVTAPELPLRGKENNHHTIFTQHGNFDFFAKGCITSMEFIDQDRVLVLLRDYSYLTHRQKITLLALNLLKNSNTNTEMILKMDSKKGWKIDNFEGLTKVGERLYLIVSDNNDNMFEKTLFVLFTLPISNHSTTE